MSQAPLLTRVAATTPGAAAAASDSTALRAPVAGTVTRVSYTPEAAIAGAATNNRTVQVINRGQSGAGAVVVATLTYDAGVNGVAYDEQNLTLQAANLVIAAGDVLEFRSSPNGTGLADPGGSVLIEVNR